MILWVVLLVKSVKNEFKPYLTSHVDDYIYSSEWHIKYLSRYRREFERKFREKFVVGDLSLIGLWMESNAESIRLSVEGFCAFPRLCPTSFNGFFDPRLALDAGWVYVRPFPRLEFLISVDFLDRMFVLGGLP